MAYAQSTDAYGGCLNVAVAAAKATDTVIVAAPSRLCRVLVTAVGSANTQIFDNATVGSGVVIAIIKTTAAVGDFFDFSMPAMNGITVKGLATNCGFTISYN